MESLVELWPYALLLLATIYLLTPLATMRAAGDAMRVIASLALGLACLALQLEGQGPAQRDATIDTATRQQVITGVLARLKEAYVFPDTPLTCRR